MPIKITQWKPDTCNCVIEYQWDTEDTKDQKTITVTNHQRCQFHTISDDVFKENRAKNLGKDNVKSSLSTQGKDPVDDDITWSFDADRNIQYSYKGQLLVTEKTNVQDTLDNGVNKVYNPKKAIIN